MTPIEQELHDKFEKAWKEQEPQCHSCGWMPCFYEVGPWEETKPGEYNASCVSQDDDCPSSHRGHFIYLEPGLLNEELP